MTQPDQLYRYLFEHHQVRGELVQLEQTCASMLQAQPYPLAVRQILAEMLVATSLLTATLKFEGSITVQLQGQGPLRLAVINGDHQQQLRGVARWEGDLDQPLSFRELIGDGHMVITITPDQGERYQGIIALEQDSLAACLEQYFAQSEQLATRIWIRTQTSDEASAAAGMLLQALPAQDDNHEAYFEHLATLTDTIKDEELFALPATEILYRLYHEEEVRVFEPQAIRFHCTCSRHRCEQALLQVGLNEAEAILAEQGTIDMHCDYCGSHYQFDTVDVQALFHSSRQPDSPQTH